MSNFLEILLIAFYIQAGIATSIWVYKDNKKHNEKTPLLMVVMIVFIWPMVVLALIEI